MKVPKYIVAEMRKMCECNAKAAAHCRKVEAWMENNGIDPDNYRTGSGVGLDELDYGVDVVDQLCEMIEEGNDE